MNKKIIIAIIIVLAITLTAIYFIFPNFFSKMSRVVNLSQEKPKVIEENLIIPQTQKITPQEGRIVEKGAVEVLFAPKTESEKVIVPKAILTVKGSYNLAVLEAQKWSADAIPVFVKSLGAITLDGKSSQWQLAFSSKLKSKLKKGYEIIIQADQIVSKKEIDSTASGASLPAKWKDSGEVIDSLRQHPYFSDASVSSINFYYNLDDKKWGYAFATSKGTTSALVE